MDGDDEAEPGTDGSVSGSDGIAPEADGTESGIDGSASEADGTEPGTDGSELDTDGRSTGADDESALGVAVVSIGVGRSDEGTNEESDVLAALEASIDGIEHEVAIRERIATDFDTVQATVSRLADRDDVDVVLTAGGIGIGPDDETVGAVGQLVDAELSAFETLFTTRVAERVGTDVLSMRPLAGVIAGVPVFCLPDDVETATVAMSDLVAPRLPRVVSLASPPLAGSDDEAEHT